MFFRKLSKEQYTNPFLANEERRISFSANDIFAEEWQKLDFLLEDIAKGRKKELELMENETFLHILAAVKSNAREYLNIPCFIRDDEICQRYCISYNMEVLQYMNTKMSNISVYKKYLQIE